MIDTRFSIMLPYYGPKTLLQEAVTSALHQDQPDGWSLTVIDDAYPDLSGGEWVQGLNDPRIRYIRNETNLGLAANFQRALELTRGDYTTFLGSDDRLLPNYIDTLMQLTAAYPGVDIAQPGVRVINGQGVVTRPVVDLVKSAIRPRLGNRPWRCMQGEQLAASLMRGDWAYFPSIAWKTTSIQRYGFSTGMDTALDLQLLMDVISRGGRLVLGSEVSFEYRRHKESVSSELARDGARFREENELFERMRSNFASLGWRRASRAAHWHVTSRAYQLLTRVWRG